MTVASTAEPASVAGLPPPGRFIDKGAKFAANVGIGMALVIAIAFELIVAVQSLPFIIAPLAGLLIGGYANQRSERWRPRRRVFANAAYAGFVTGLSLAIIYVLLRLLFIFVDTGTLPTGATLTCQTGPDCTYQRYVQLGEKDQLAAAGIVDGPSFGAAALREQLNGGVILVLLTTGGALVAAGFRSVRKPGGAAVKAAV